MISTIFASRPSAATKFLILVLLGRVKYWLPVVWGRLGSFGVNLGGKCKNQIGFKFKRRGIIRDGIFAFTIQIDPKIFHIIFSLSLPLSRIYTTKG